jgi:hypothetical protein
MVVLTRFATMIVVCVAVLSAGCGVKKETPQIRLLSEQEADDLWNKAERREPVGEPVVKTTEDESGTTVTSTQVYMLSMPGGGGSTGLGAVCGGSCIGGIGSECKTSGCMPSGRSCTPLNCSGTCTLKQACRREAIFVIQ